MGAARFGKAAANMSNLWVLVGDLGLARTVSDSQPMASTFVGTPHYCAPEIFNGDPYDEKADIYSFGVCVYELMHGRVPHADVQHIAALVRRVVCLDGDAEAHELPSMDARFSLELRSWVGSCLAMAPTDRPCAADLLGRVPTLYRVGGVSGSSGKTSEERGSACASIEDTASALRNRTAAACPPAFKPPARSALAKASGDVPATAKATSQAASPVALVAQSPSTTPAIAVPLATPAAENIEFADAAASPPKAIAEALKPDATTGASVQPSSQDASGECSDATVSSPAEVAEPEQHTHARAGPDQSPSRRQLSAASSGAVGVGEPAVAVPAPNCPGIAAPSDKEAVEVTIADAEWSEALDTTLRPALDTTLRPVAPTETAAVAVLETARSADDCRSPPRSVAYSASQDDDSGVGRSPSRQHRVARACSGKLSRRDPKLYVSRAQECWMRWRRERREAKGRLVGKVARATKSEAPSSPLSSSCTSGLEVRGVAVPRTPKVERHAGRP